jgi:hypothetical protein
MDNRPEKKFKAGAVTATLWKNQGEKGSYATVQLSRNYKDGENWKSTSSLRAADLPKAALVLQKAYEHLTLESSGESEMEAVI